MPLNRRIVLDDKDINSPDPPSNPEPMFTDPETRQGGVPAGYPHHLPHLRPPETVQVTSAKYGKPNNEFTPIKLSEDDPGQMYNDFVQLNEIHRTHKIRCLACGQINFHTDFIERRLKCKSCERSMRFDDVFAEYGR
jgi:hypothetical protein